MQFIIDNSQFSNKKQKAKTRALKLLSTGQAKTKIQKILYNQFYRAVCIVALFLMALVFIPSGNQFAYAEMTDAEYNQQINNLNAQKNTANNNLGIKKLEDKSLTGEVAKFDNQIYTIQSQINSTQSQIDSINSQIADANKKISEAEASIKIKKESLNEYLRVMYEDSNVSTIELIAASDSFSDFVDKTEYNLTMQEKIKRIVSEVKTLKKELEAKKTELSKNGQEIEKLKSQQVAQRQGLDGQRASKNRLLQNTKGEEKEYKKQLANLQKEIDSVDAAYTLAKSNGASAATSYTGGVSTGGGNTGQNYLSWPSSGGVYQEWGWTDLANSCFYKYNGACTIHNGLDISTGNSGNPINAAADGTVYDTGYGYSGGWGNWVAIRHSGSLNGLVTFYAHLSGVSVSPGQVVTRGQKIGNEGSTGISIDDAVHLHFSVYTSFTVYNSYGYHGPEYNGTANPRSFLR